MRRGEILLYRKFPCERTHEHTRTRLHMRRGNTKTLHTTPITSDYTEGWKIPLKGHPILNCLNRSARWTDVFMIGKESKSFNKYISVHWCTIPIYIQREKEGERERERKMSTTYAFNYKTSHNQNSYFYSPPPEGQRFNKLNFYLNI